MSPKLSRWKSVFPLACALISLAACSDDTEDPVRSKAQMLYGTWDLQAAQDVGEGDLEFSYTFQADGSVRNRIGGAFLAELRNIDAVRQALDDGPLADDNLLDGGNVNWVGTWSLAGDSLTVNYDLLIVEVFGRVPILGKVTVPVFDETLDPAAQTSLGFTCQLEGDVLTLRGESLTAGVDVAGGGGPVGLEGPGSQAVDLAVQFLGEQIVDQGLDAQTFQHR
jgi:hypothetical protein